MARFLLKTEPSTYAFDDLIRERTTAWTGVKNPLARRHLASMAAGDEVVIYHSGECAAVGLGTVVRAAYPDPTADGAGVCVDVAAGARLTGAVPLEALKGEPAFEDSPLLRQGRLSVVPLTASQWLTLLRLGRAPAPARPGRARAGSPSSN
jgi:predicted RNA-binding protein with PUA-like domain